MDGVVQATQLLSEYSKLGCSTLAPDAVATSQASAEFRRVPCSGSAKTPDGIEVKVEKNLIRRLFVEGTDTGEERPTHECEKPLPPPSKGAVASVLAPQTPAGIPLKSADEHEKKTKLFRTEVANLTEGNSGRGPVTPEGFVALLGAQEKGLICDMLDSFPPAQGIDSPGGVDPFHDQFLETAHQADSNLPTGAKDPLLPMQDGRTLESVPEVDRQYSLDNAGPPLLKPFFNSDNAGPPLPTPFEGRCEETLGQLWPKTKRLSSQNPGIPRDSDDDELPALPQASEDSKGETAGETGPKENRQDDGLVDDGRPAPPQPSEDSEDETIAEIWRNKKRQRDPSPVTDSQAGDRPAPVPNCSEGSEEETSGLKKRRRKNMVVVIDSDDGADVADQAVVDDVREGTEDSSMSGPNVGEFDSGMGSQTSHPPASKDKNSDQTRPSSPSIKDLFGLEGEGEEEGNAPGTAIGGGMTDLGRSGSIKSIDPMRDPLSRDSIGDRRASSPRSVNVILSSCDEGDDVCEGSRGSGKKGKRKRLVRVGESPDEAESLRPDPLLPKEDNATKVLRRSERLRAGVSNDKSGRSHSQQEEESDSIEDSDREGEENLGTSADGSSSKPVVLDDDSEEDRIEDDDSDDGRPFAARPKKRATQQSSRSYAVQRDLFGMKRAAESEEDDIDTDDSFINDEPESGDEACNASPADEISESGGDESESDGLPDGEGSAGESKKYKWDYESDMLADLGKDNDLCLRGLCAVFRRQEYDEKIDSDSKYNNKRGFSKFHAARASRYANFLMGDLVLSEGPVVKTLQEFRNAFDESAVNYCRNMCMNYSKQLFEIYENKEDPFFPEPYKGPM